MYEFVSEVTSVSKVMPTAFARAEGGASRSQGLPLADSKQGGNGEVRGNFGGWETGCYTLLQKRTNVNGCHCCTNQRILTQQYSRNNARRPSG